MTKKGVRKLAKKMIEDGRSHQETFNEIKDLCDFSVEEIAKIMKLIPSKSKKEKNKVANTVLFIVLCFTIVQKIFFGLSLIEDLEGFAILIILLFPLLNVYFAYNVAVFNTPIYRMIAFFTIISIIQSLKNISGITMDIFALIDIVIAIALIFLGFYLNTKMTVLYEVSNEKYENQNGESRLRKVITFEEEQII